MLVSASGFTASVPKSRGRTKSALKLVPASRMHWKLRQGNPFQLVHLSRLVDLLLQVVPLPANLLPCGAHLFGCRILYLVFLLRFLIRRHKPQDSIRRR